MPQINRIVIGHVLDNNTATIGNTDLTDVYLGGTDGYSASLRASSVYLAEGDQISNASSVTMIVFSGNITVKALT